MHFLPKQFSLTTIRTAPPIVKLLMIEQFLEGFVPITALYAIMFSRVGHLDLKQIGLLFSIWSLAYVVAELPSGVLADYWSRKNMVALGGLLRAVGLAIWLIWPTFTGYAIGFALWGCMIACTSGAMTAYLHNELTVDKKGRQFAKYFGWVMAALYIGQLAGILVAALLTLKHTTALIGMSVAASAAIPLLLFAAHESPYKKHDTYLKTLKGGLREITESKQLRYICYGLFSVYMVIGVLEELLPRVYASFGLGDSQVALVVAAALLATIFILARLESFVKFSLSKQLLITCLGILFLVAGLWLGGLGGVGLVLLFSLVFQLFRPVFQHHIMQTAQSQEKATIGSIPGLAGGLFGAGAYSIIGLVAQKTSERRSIGLYGIFWLVILLILAIMGRKYRSSVQDVQTDPSSLGLQSHTVSTVFGTLHYVGPAQPTGDEVVLFLHGFGRTWDVWTPLLRVAADENLLHGKDVLLVDLPSFGKSENNLGHLRSEDIGKELCKLAASLGYKKIHLVGHSMGGFLALDMAAHQPMVASVRVAAGSYFTLLRVANNPKGYIKESPAVTVFYGVQQFLAKHPHLSGVVNGIAKARGSLFEVGGPSFKYASQNGLNYDAHGAWGSISVPVTAVFGGRDKLVNARDMKELQQVVPAAVVQMIPNTTHFLLVEKPTEVARALFADFRKPSKHSISNRN